MSSSSEHCWSQTWAAVGLCGSFQLGGLERAASRRLLGGLEKEALRSLALEKRSLIFICGLVTAGPDMTQSLENGGLAKKVPLGAGQAEKQVSNAAGSAPQSQPSLLVGCGGGGVSGSSSCIGGCCP